MRVIALLLLGAVWLPGTVRGQPATTLTDSLVKAFHEEWNENDLEGMVAMLQPDAFFESPHQLRYGRDSMAATVLQRNPPVIRDCVTEERHSRVEGDLAWSIGELHCNTYFRDTGRIRRERVRIRDGYAVRNMYDEDGSFLGTQEHPATIYTYVFTRRGGGPWKVQMLIYHEEG